MSQVNLNAALTANSIVAADITWVDADEVDVSASLTADSSASSSLSQVKGLASLITGGSSLSASLTGSFLFAPSSITADSQLNQTLGITVHVSASLTSDSTLNSDLYFVDDDNLMTAVIIADSSISPALSYAFGPETLTANLAADSSLTPNAHAVYVLTRHITGDSGITPNLTGAYPLAGSFVGGGSLSGSLVNRLSAAIVADSQLGATALLEDVSAPIVADSNVVTDGTVAYAIAGSATTGADLSASLVAAYTIGSSISANSSISAYWGQFLSGEADGAATVSGGIQVIIPFAGEADGQATVVALAVPQVILLSGHAYGVGDFTENIDVDLAGVASGHGTLSTPHLPALLLASGRASGSSKLVDSGPLPIVGLGAMFGFLALEKILRPVNCPPCPPVLQFRWGQVFSLGDLQLTITDSTGTRFRTPVNVTYTMFQLAKSGVPMQVGPTKQAVMQKNGVFYAVGTAGEGGQPGNWLVRWCYQANYSSPFTVADQCFTVVDSISGPIVGDPTCRVTKYGWD